MTQLVSPRYLAVAALLLAGGGLIGFACGSDDRVPSVNDDTTPTSGNEPPAGTGGSAATTPAAPPAAPAGTGTAPPVASGGSEGVPTNIPVAPGEQPPATPPPATPGPETPPPPATPPSAGLEPNCSAAEGDVPALTLELVADGLTDPLYATAAPGDDSRLFVVERAGRVRVIVDGELQEQPFLDISGSVTAGGERGLLGLAFHPDYATNGLFYVHFTSQAAQNRGQLAEFSVDPNNRSLATPASRRDVLLFPTDPESNHNGGSLVFGADGFLYAGLGDGGGSNDQHGANGNGQNLQTLFAKLLRLDVNGRDVNNAYSIPPNNLAAQTGQQALPEIWAYGLRNPWRFSFDACTQDLYIGDVGQNTLEEIDFLPSTALAGSNFGWRLMEGPACRPGDAACPNADRSTLVLPIDSYGRNVGQSVTGGYVYRGSAIPGLRGRYVYADYQTAAFFTFQVQNGQMANRQVITNQLQGAAGGGEAGISSFGQDNAGELYVTTLNTGGLYRIVAAP